MNNEISKLADENLYNLCKVYGGKALMWRQKFIGLLPEVFKRKLFEKKGFDSIFEFAKKLAGLSEEQVRLTLNLEKKFEKLPELKSLLVNGEVSVNKLARVASIASEQNEKFLVENVRNLSKSAVETLVRDEKFARQNFGEFGTREYSNFENQNDLIEPLFEVKSVPGHRLQLSDEVQEKLLELQEKGIDVNQLLQEFLNQREEGIAQKKQEIRKQVLEKEDARQEEGKDPTRYRPQAVEEIIRAEYGTKCAVKNCKKTWMHIHHVLPFSVGKTNDPKFLIPLCAEHHQMEHVINDKYIEVRAEVAGSS